MRLAQLKTTVAEMYSRFGRTATTAAALPLNVAPTAIFVPDLDTMNQLLTDLPKLDNCHIFSVAELLTKVDEAKARGQTGASISTIVKENFQAPAIRVPSAYMTDATLLKLCRTNANASDMLAYQIFSNVQEMNRLLDNNNFNVMTKEKRMVRVVEHITMAAARMSAATSNCNNLLHHDLHTGGTMTFVAQVICHYAKVLAPAAIGAQRKKDQADRHRAIATIGSVSTDTVVSNAKAQLVTNDRTHENAIITATDNGQLVAAVSNLVRSLFFWHSDTGTYSTSAHWRGTDFDAVIVNAVNACMRLDGVYLANAYRRAQTVGVTTSTCFDFNGVFADTADGGIVRKGLAFILPESVNGAADSLANEITTELYEALLSDRPGYSRAFSKCFVPPQSLQSNVRCLGRVEADPATLPLDIAIVAIINADEAAQMPHYDKEFAIDLAAQWKRLQGRLTIKEMPFSSVLAANELSVSMVGDKSIFNATEALAAQLEGHLVSDSPALSFAVASTYHADSIDDEDEADTGATIAIGKAQIQQLGEDMADHWANTPFYEEGKPFEDVVADCLHEYDTSESFKCINDTGNTLSEIELELTQSIVNDFKQTAEHWAKIAATNYVAQNPGKTRADCTVDKFLLLTGKSPRCRSMCLWLACGV